MGVIGVIVPGLPSTVFILMAAWAAARSSPRLYRWLWFHPLFGSMLRNWANGGRVSRHAKWSATFLMDAVRASSCLGHDRARPRWAAYMALRLHGLRTRLAVAAPLSHSADIASHRLLCAGRKAPRSAAFFMYII